MLRLVTSSPVVLMVALAVYGQVHAGTSPPNPSQSSTTEATSYQVLQAILKHDDPIRTIGRINQRFVLLTEKKNLFDLPASAWDNSSHKLKLDNVTTVEKHWPQLLSASPIALDPPDQSTLLAFDSSEHDKLLWIPHQAGSCPVMFNIAEGRASNFGPDVCGKQPGLDNPSTRYISSSENNVYYYSTQSTIFRAELAGDFNEKPATNCTSPLNYTVGFQDGPKYYLFSSQADHLDIVDMATCQIESMKLSSFFVCTPDPTTPSTTIKFAPNVSISSGGSNIGLIVGIVGGVIVALLLIGLAVWFFRKKRSHGSKPSSKKRNKESKGSSSKMAAATSSGSALKLGSSMPSGSAAAAAAPIVKNSKGTVKAKPTKGSVVSGRNKSARNKSARNKSARTKSTRDNSARVKSTRATVHKSVHKSHGIKIKSDNIPTAWHTDKIKESPPKAKALPPKTKAAGGGKVAKAPKQNRKASKRKTSKGGKAKA